MGKLLRFERKNRASSVADRAENTTVRDHFAAIAQTLPGALTLLDQIAARLQQLNGCFSTQPRNSNLEAKRKELLNEINLAHRHVDLLLVAMKGDGRG